MTLVIAEAGVNHNGSFRVAKKMVEVAHDIHADFVKFQAFNYLEETKLLKLRLSLNSLSKLIDYAEEIGIAPLVTPFTVMDASELRWCLGQHIMKVSHREDPALWKYIGGLGVTVFASAIDRSQAVRMNADMKPTAIMYTIDEYPATEVNIEKMVDFAGIAPGWGYSDHTRDLAAATAAIEAGADIIEKHFMLNDEGYEAEWSVGPDELGELVRIAHEADNPSNWRP